ncbi:MAG TPA: hypothetical protein PK251_13650 [Candidatus Latescibacteria bacterium]|nr:hypothetical protein [Candidatus Latescibacterota bacterium]HPK74678.1 hypothetical protein [Candidatus Latescibacterota bacterium]
MRISLNGQRIFPLGAYEHPWTEDEWRQWTAAGVNIVCCHNREELDAAHAHGVLGWVPVPVILADGDAGSTLAAKVDTLKDHPALAVWEAQDEAIWNASRKDDNNVRMSFWKHPPEKLVEIQERFSAVVRGLERGARIVRERDPHRPIWLNEAVNSDQETLARCVPYLDIVGFDWYPVRRNATVPMGLLGKQIQRFVRTAPLCGQWFVQQAFCWSQLKLAEGPPLLPTEEQTRFMAWDAILHGATGIMWWGSAYADRPHPFFDGWMTVLREFEGLHPFLFAGQMPHVWAETYYRQHDPILGVGVLARRAGNRTLVVLINQDQYAHETVLKGLDEAVVMRLRRVGGGGEGLVKTREGFITALEGYDVRIYITD